MLPAAQKKRVRDVWHHLRAAGISNPLSALEHISYLMLLKHLDERDTKEKLVARRKGVKFKSIFHDQPECRWSFIKKQPPQVMLELIEDQAFPFLKSLDLGGGALLVAMKDAVFTLKKPAQLHKAIQLVDKLPTHDRHFDLAGDVYEEFLGELNLAGKNGQFLTPRHIIRAAVELADPQLGEYVCDPAAGTGGFLIGAHQWVLKQYTSQQALRTAADGSWHNLSGGGVPTRMRGLLKGDRLSGYDFDASMTRVGLMNLLLHGVKQPHLFQQDTICGNFAPGREYDLVVSDPPFGGMVETGKVDAKIAQADTARLEILFVELCHTLLRKGGRAALIVPESVLINPTDEYKRLRQKLVEKNNVRAVVNLPRGCFLPYTSARPAILLFEKGGRTKRVWFYDVASDGYSLDPQRTRVGGRGDLRYVPQAYRILALGKSERWDSTVAERVARQHVLEVTRKQIVESEFNLSSDIYRHATQEVQAQEDPRQIMARIRTLGREIGQGLDDIEEALGRL